MSELAISTDVQHRQAFHQLEQMFWQAISRESLHPSAQVHCYCSESSALGFNFIFVHAGAKPADLQHVMQFCAQQQIEYILVCERDAALLSDIQQDTQFSADGSTTAMGLDLKTWQALPSQSTHTIDITLQDRSALADWAEPLNSAFADGDEQLTQQLLRAHQQALDAQQPLYHFVLRTAHQGSQQVVAALTLSIDQQIARLDDIGTRQDAQAKGYATALIQHALIFAQQHGVQHCYLEASAQGLSIYQKIGFRALFQNENFIRLNT
ncbi:GNAT family N-acetyltransferase [Acinetobacter larvae]|uniref:N-acetyltransferase domain-containing protein n=1 Tax=Acinetobacter larvae TaxID=1789224 RepID=A0A1B2LWB2_9GAMM|nr:GNAT family N-acetyltransferase [Acinetobacter larvae]AOA57225.1 hypothetical protein BFG52_01885 [Acinetobacter larvae]